MALTFRNLCITGVSESNMMAYLGIIEHRTNQLLHRFHVPLFFSFF